MQQGGGNRSRRARMRMGGGAESDSVRRATVYTHRGDGRECGNKQAYTAVYACVWLGGKEED